jgi:hypothetical protein
MLGEREHEREDPAGNRTGSDVHQASKVVEAPAQYRDPEERSENEERHVLDRVQLRQ